MPATFDNDITTVQDALVSLCAAATDPNGGSITAAKRFPNDGLLSSQIPFLWVRRGRQFLRDEIATDLYSDTRQYQVLIYVESLADGELDDESEFDNAVDWIKYFHKYLAQNRHFVEASEIVVVDVRDSGDVNMFGKDGIRYSGVAFTIPIKTLTRF